MTLEFVADDLHGLSPDERSDAATSIRPSRQPQWSETMGYSSPNHLKKLAKLPRKIADAAPSTSDFSAFLRNQHPSDTVYWVASLGGFRESTVEAWIYEKALPQARHLGPLLAIYGPAVLAAIFPKGFGWLDDAVRAEKLRALEARRAEIDHEMRQLQHDDMGDCA